MREIWKGLSPHASELMVVSSWKKQMTFYLENTDLWDIVHDDLPAPDQRTAVWNRQNSRALGTIYTTYLLASIVL